MAPKKIHLVSNAHLDPVWLWEWEEGAAEALSTFRQAADFCEQHPGFVFCHNEAVLYRWVEEYEPALFRRIQDLVRQNRWHVMGGWYVQPDCNMPSGESFVRQILLGRGFFKHKLGVEPRTAVNLDPFGHTRGLVQVLAKSGYDYYLCCRPGNTECPLASDEFVWVGYDGSEVLANRASAHYCSAGGRARARLEDWLAANGSKDPVIHLWGIGNHGGGPSRKDLEDFDKFRAAREDYELVHSTPDAYFAELEQFRDSLPRREKDLNPWAVGCYTSMSRVKQGHRRLENELFSAEKMLTSAWSQGLLEYPNDDLRKATEDLAFIEFHDILPGSAIPAAEEAALRRIDHGLEILARLKARAFFALASGEPKAAPGEIPIFVFNPHPYPVNALVECEFEPWEQNYEKTFWTARLSHAGKPVASQVEKEASNLSVEWRKKVVFEAALEPARLTRFDCRLESIPQKPDIIAREKGGFVSVQNDELTVLINAQTGLLDLYQVKGLDYLAEGAFRPLVIEDNADPWGMKVRSFRTVEGAFSLASPEVAALHSGQRGGEAPPVRVVEEGEVRTVIESILAYGKSRLVFRYKIPRKGTAIEVEARVTWAEKDRMLKLSLPSRLRGPKFMGQVAFGADELPSNGDEAVAQKWLALVSEREDAAFTVINEGTHGSDYYEGELRLSLLRSPAYSADTWEDKLAVTQDRFIPRQDQGERTFRFWINGGPLKDTMAAVDRDALARNERPYILPFCPAGGEKKDVKSGITVSGTAAIVSAFKKAEEGDDIIVRLFEPTGTARQLTLGLPAFRLSKKLRLKGFEVRTMRFSPGTGSLVQTDLLERHGGKK